jgi:lipid II:glycine glycyltransferase (peptidoglycan interpeptide bridge formation enzyme)
MAIRLLSSPEDLGKYDAWIKGHKDGTLWQSLEWKTYQEALGREVKIYGAFDGSRITASALVIIDRTTGGFSTWDIPRGPIGEHAQELMETIANDAKADRCMSIFFSPNNLTVDFSQRKAIDSHRCEQSPATRIIDLTPSLEDILAQMHQKGRYNIKVAEKNEVTVEESTDVDAFYQLLRSTGGRDGFTIHPKMQYVRFLEQMKTSFLLLAMHDKKPVAGLIGVTWNNVGLYYYGASDYAQRALMAPYALQWEAMKRCKAVGCTSYDLLGIAPAGAPSNHPWAGISDFKSKFGGTVIEYPHEQEIILKPGIQKLLQIKRKLLG